MFAQPHLAWGEEIRTTFIGPPGKLIEGNSTSFWLYGLNEGETEAAYSFPQRIDCQIHYSDGNKQDAGLVLKHPEQSQVVIPAHAFAKAEYSLDGRFVRSDSIRIEIAPDHQIFAEVKAPAKQDLPPTGTVSQQPPPQVEPSKAPTEKEAMIAFFNRHLSTYEPIYFLLGTYPAAEFQYSLKYQLVTATNTWKSLNDLYFGFTQTSYWDLLTKDPSFYDTSYKPGLFYKSDLIRKGRFDFDLEVGANHESNGRGGMGERSMYSAYLQPTLSYRLTPTWTFTLQPRGWYYLALGDNNTDLADYRGYGDLLTALTWQDPTNTWEKVQLSSRLQVGDKGWRPGLWVDFRFFLPKVGDFKFNPSIQVQYFVGYGQTFRQYNQYSHGLRAGLCLWY